MLRVVPKPTEVAGGWSGEQPFGRILRRAMWLASPFVVSVLMWWALISAIARAIRHGS